MSGRSFMRFGPASSSQSSTRFGYRVGKINNGVGVDELLYTETDLNLLPVPVWQLFKVNTAKVNGNKRVFKQPKRHRIDHIYRRILKVPARAY